MDKDPSNLPHADLPRDGNEFKIGHYGITSAISSLKEMVTIVIGVSISSAVYQIMTAGTGVAYKFEDIGLRRGFLFFLLIFNLLRFYHGNIRHLDTTYTFGPGKGGSASKTSRDFFVIFSEILALSILSFLLRMPLRFFGILTGLLLVDAMWILYIVNMPDDKTVYEYQRHWFVNNLVTAILGVIILASHTSLGLDVCYDLLLAVFGVNTILDFSISWKFYFPEG